MLFWLVSASRLRAQTEYSGGETSITSSSSIIYVFCFGSYKISKKLIDLCQFLTIINKELAISSTRIHRPNNLQHLCVCMVYLNFHSAQMTLKSAASLGNKGPTPTATHNFTHVP